MIAMFPDITSLIPSFCKRLRYSLASLKRLSSAVSLSYSSESVSAWSGT